MPKSKRAPERQLVIAPSDPEARLLAKSMVGAVYLPPADGEPFDDDDLSAATFAARSSAIRAIDEGGARAIVCGPCAVVRRVPDREATNDAFALEAKEKITPSELAEKLASLAYREVERVVEPGTFARGGQTLDAWPADGDAPIRVRFADGRIERLQFFDPTSQRTTDTSSVEARFPRAGLPGMDVEAHSRRTILECLGEATVLADPGTIDAVRRRVVEIDREEAERRERGEPIARRAAWLREDELDALKPSGPPPAIDGSVTPERQPASGEAALSERLAIGDLVVHLHHGIGRFEGLSDDPTAEGEVLTIAFADGTLHVPAAEADLVWRYGPATENDDARIDKMGSPEWTARLATINAAIRDAADAFEARRADNAKREAPALDWDAEALRRLAEAWHPLTADQATALNEVRGDTVADNGKVRPPMDRLLCGDTGYGKTEILLRAAVAAVEGGLQVAVAAPTHILATQHCETFHERLSDLDIRVDCLTGTTDPDEAEGTLQALRSGKPMVVVGTHRLAGEDIEFGKPGLLVIDEEQRFGSELKGALRAKMPQAHVLATTATPIPRTTASAIVGLRAISTLRRPPAGRRSVRTLAPDWSEDTLRRALLTEREEGGRTFVVVSRIADMDAVADGLGRLVPDLRIARVHGRMDDGDVGASLSAFRGGDCDVLLATTMIETGIDVPTANLMVVLDPARLGLAQLHQLRGRVGRSDRRGRVLVFTQCPWIESEGDEDTEARVSILLRHTGIGAGFDIAADDLAQRGAGDLFGDEQRGHLVDVGLELFGYLFRDATKGGGRAVAQLGTARMATSGARLPVGYVPNETVRARFYGRIARATSSDELDEVRDEIVDRFGPLPEPARQLIEDARLTIRLRADGVQEIDFGPLGVAATFSSERANELRERSANAIEWKGDRAILKGKGAGPADLLREVEATS